MWEQLFSLENFNYTEEQQVETMMEPVYWDLQEYMPGTFTTVLSWAFWASRSNFFCVKEEKLQHKCIVFNQNVGQKVFILYFSVLPRKETGSKSNIQWKL